MNDKVPKIVNSEKDLKVEYEKATEGDRQLIMQKINTLENERSKEKQILGSQIDHTKKLDELIKIKRREINESTNNYQASTHSELKQIQIKTNDVAKVHKEKYNNLVNSINDIINN